MPVHRRHWCLDRWFDSLHEQDVPADTRLVFLLSEPGDPSERIILKRAPRAELIYSEGLPAFDENEKDDPRRYAVLAHLRNRLLRIVQSIGPEHYLSWDSDILLRRGSLAHMLACEKDAVGALTDMGGDVFPGHWSWMTLEGKEAFREEGKRLPALFAAGEPKPWDSYLLDGRWGVTAKVGVIMGVKLLSPKAYRSVRYADHILGEDVAWAVQAEALNIERWLCPEARGEHLYRLEALA